MLSSKSDPIRRGIRTLIALCATAALVVPAVAAVFNVPAGRVAQIVGAFTVTGTALTTLWNALEDNTKFPAILKATPSPGKNPTPDPG